MAMTSSRRDGGYGWVIVFAFFLSEMVMDGIRFSFGMLYVEWLQYFQGGKGETAWIGSILIGVYNIGGPLFAVIVNKLGYRPSYILGALLSTVGYVLSFFATDIHFLYFSFGVLPGLGFGIIMLAGTGSVGRYFFSRRALAIGISYSGSGIGTMIFNPLARILLDTFGWRGTMFIYASFTLNMCVFGSLQRPFVAAEDTQEIVSLEVTDNLKQQHYNPSEQLDDVAAEINTTVTVADRLNGDGNKLVEPLETNLSYDKDVVADDEIANTKEHNIRETNAVKDDYYKVLKNQCDNEICVNAPLLNNPKGDICQCSLQKSVTIPNENASTENEPMLRCVSNGLAFQKKNGRDKANQTVSQTHEFNKTEHMRTFNKVDHSEISETIKSLPNIHKRTLLSDVLKPKLHESLTSLQSLKRPPLIVSQNILGSSASFDILVERQQCSVTEKTFHNENNEKTKMTNIFATLICSAFPKELVTNANFIILMVATFFYGVAAYIPIALLPAYCLYVGCRIEKTGWLISLFGVTGILSRLLGGWITDLPCVNRLLFFLSLILLIGVTTLLLPILHSYELLMVYAAGLGLSMGATYVVQPIFLFEYFGDKYMVEIFGIMMLNYGLSSLIGTPIAGWLIDGTGDYNMAFLFAGVNCILSVALHLYVLCQKPTPYTIESQLDVEQPTVP